MARQATRKLIVNHVTVCACILAGSACYRVHGWPGKRRDGRARWTPANRPERGDTGDDVGGVEQVRLYESTRVEAFSDGVLAIAITLLVLDLSSRSNPGHVLAALLRQWPAYLAYLASFGFIGVIWVTARRAHEPAALLLSPAPSKGCGMASVSS